jgi:hypothetical protein
MGLHPCSNFVKRQTQADGRSDNFQWGDFNFSSTNSGTIPVHPTIKEQLPRSKLMGLQDKGNALSGFTGLRKRQKRAGKTTVSLRCLQGSACLSR